MKFFADLHIHSRFSRATSKDLDVENLHIGAQRKGITVLGTGDITHPGWLAEISEKLVPAEPGLYALKPELAKDCQKRVPGACQGPVRFVLTAEVSNIYKKNGTTRKNHNLICLPDLDAVRGLCAKLAKIGNITSDGRPILGLDSRDLLEMVLESGACLIPAHIWTPWFSLLGSKSGFDSVTECFGDLSDHIFALETGLSSDPAMNWRLSQLDRFTLVSNSDAHSAAKIGREATIFNTGLSYPEIIAALTSGDGVHYQGTIEFFPEEGKYHLDGHRGCQQRFTPSQTRENRGICPVCGKQITLGVMYRVEELADRPEGDGPSRRHPFYNLVPLDEIIAEILRVGTGTKAVVSRMEAVLELLGNEIAILLTHDPAIIARAGIPLLEEAIVRMRAGRVTIEPGYDGQYGKVRLFSDAERGRLMGQPSLFACPSPTPDPLPTNQKPPVIDDPQPPAVRLVASADDNLNAEQAAVLAAGDQPLMVVAGPGTGKTFTITRKIAELIRRHDVSPQQILAMTFTQKAAREMRQRLERLLPDDGNLPLVTTFHGFCLQFWRETHPQATVTIVGEEDRLALIREALPLVRQTKPRPTLETVSRFIETAKQQLRAPAAEGSGDTVDATVCALNAVYAAYQDLLKIQGLMDYEDLIFQTVKTLTDDPGLAAAWQARFTHVFVDEYQDINFSQQRLIERLSPKGQNLCVIGDPDQSIYGFRGSQPGFFLGFTELFPQARVIHLTRNYRSTDVILKASSRMIADHRLDNNAVTAWSSLKTIDTIAVMEAASEKAEAVMVGKTIEKMVGGTGFFAIDAGKVDTKAEMGANGQKAFADFAVIYRTHEQSRVLAEVFAKAGIPFEVASRNRLLADPVVAALLSWLRLLYGQAGLLDLQRAADGLVPSSAFSVLKAWSLQNRWNAATAMTQIRRFPLPGLSLSQQKRICAFFAELDGVQKKLSGLNVPARIEALTPLVLARIKAPEKVHLETLQEVAHQHPDSLPDFLAATALLSDTDLCRRKGERVSLLTMHAAKGMEFDVVFIVGAEDGLVPLAHSHDMDEERRLFYVAMTRARHTLVISHCRRRRLFGQNQPRQMSPFVADIGSRLLAYQRPDASPQKPKGPEQLGLF